MLPFSPGSATVNINVANSSNSVLITNQRGEVQIRVMNNSSATAWIAFGGSGVVATAGASIPVPAGAIEVFTLVVPFSDNLYAAAIAAGATGNIYFTPGAGI